MVQSGGIDAHFGLEARIGKTEHMARGGRISTVRHSSCARWCCVICRVTVKHDDHAARRERQGEERDSDVAWSGMAEHGRAGLGGMYACAMLARRRSDHERWMGRGGVERRHLDFVAA